MILEQKFQFNKQKPTKSKFSINLEILKLKQTSDIFSYEIPNAQILVNDKMLHENNCLMNMF